MNIINNNLKIY